MYLEYLRMILPQCWNLIFSVPIAITCFREYIQNKYGYSETTASYINGASYDVAVFLCPLIGIVLVSAYSFTYPNK